MGIQRTSPNDVMELVCDISGTSMQVAAVLVLPTRSTVEAAAVRSAIADRVPLVGQRGRVGRAGPRPVGRGRAVMRCHGRALG